MYCNFSVTIEEEMRRGSSTTGGSHCCTGASARVETATLERHGDLLENHCNFSLRDGADYCTKP
jgi:hypothetical protein